MVAVSLDMEAISHKVRRLLVAVLIGVTLGAVATPILVTEGALHIQLRPLPEAAQADAIARDTASTWESARVIAPDGVMLDAWLFTPREPNGSGVIVLHGVGDTRAGMAIHAAYLLNAGFTVLLPDSRGHGSSGGSVISYGIRESADVHTWADWFLKRRSIAHLFGLGQSMGAAILIESLPREPRLRAVMADCPFDSFEGVAYNLGRWASWPVVQIGLLYSRAIYGLDLRRASPAEAIRTTTVPILLIHGAADTNIPPSESIALHALNPRTTTLWMVPGAEHISSVTTSPQEYQQRVTDWFRTHP